MKPLLIIFSLIILPFTHGQTILMENIGGNNLALGVTNYLKFNIDGLEYADVRVHSSNGVVVNDSGLLHVTPDTLGRCELSFYKIDRGDSVFLGSRTIWVEKLRNPQPRMYHHNSGKIYANLIANGRIELENVEYGRVGCQFHLPVREFKIIVTRKNEIVGYVFNNGDQFTKPSLDLLKELKPGDMILFFDIVGMNYYREFVTLDTISFEVQ